jgi:hypothetical protein
MPLLELLPSDDTPPRLEAAAVIEGDSLRALTLAGPPEAGFAGFLDGIQASRALSLRVPGVPVVHGTVGAVIRQRSDRSLSTWRLPRVSRALYVPIALAGEASVAGMRAAGLEIVDTLDGAAAPDARHPQELLNLARTAIHRRRETLETALAESWCGSEDAPLYVDGGISGTGTAAKSPLVAGVVKSHRTIYAAGGALGVVMGLAAGERTTAFGTPSSRRTTVASWYLRLRDALGRDPLFGLVRVEIAHASFTPARADLVSRWVLAERAPVSLPDRRWSTMAYGVRDCEQYLRALLGPDASSRGTGRTL